MTSTIYLSGSNIESGDLSGQIPEPDWRSLAMTRLQRSGLKVLNPLELPTWPQSDENVYGQARVRRALDLIDQCDAVLANLLRASYGTAMEIFYAHRRGKTVAVVGNSPFSPWVLSHSDARFGLIDQALDYLIGEQPQVNAVSWSLQYESVLSEHYEQFPPDGEPDYQFLGGDLPVLVVAPHATAYFREGEFQEADDYTGSIAALLNRTSRCHSLLSFYCCAADPVWHLETPMRRAFADIVKSGKVALIVFLLGGSWWQGPGLKVSAFGGAEDDYLSRLRLTLLDLEPVIDNLADLEPLPLVKFASSELGVPVLAMRMHKRYRMPRLQPELFAGILHLLNQFISEVGIDILRSRS